MDGSQDRDVERRGQELRDYVVDQLSTPLPKDEAMLKFLYGDGTPGSGFVNKSDDQPVQSGYSTLGSVPVRLVRVPDGDVPSEPDPRSSARDR